MGGASKRERALRDPLPKDKEVAVLGFGASGRAAAELLSHFGKRLVISDAGPLKPNPRYDAEWYAGTNSVGEAEVAVLSPGLNPAWPENREREALRPIWERWDAGELRIVAEVDLAARALTCPWVAIGGTDGKSTTAGWTHQLFGHAGLRTVLGGNSWRALSEVVLEAAEADVAVVEVSAFQMQRGHQLRPRVVVMTNIARDHLDHYASFEDYVDAKREIVAHAEGGTHFVYNAADVVLAEWAEMLQARGVRCASFSTSAEHRERACAYVEGDDICVRRRASEVRLRRDLVALPGEHNVRNFMGAALALDAIAPDRTDEAFRAALLAAASYAGLPHRVEFVRERRGVRWFNDSKATNVHAACVGLASMSQGVCAIVGGVEKRLELTPLIDLLERKDATVIAIGELRERLEREAAGRVARFYAADSMEEAVALAAESAVAGAEVLLAPASASFDMFRSFEDRGERFREAVLALSP